MKLSGKNQHLRDEGVRLRKIAHSDEPGSTSAVSFGMSRVLFLYFLL